MWNVKRAQSNNAKAKNDSEERDQSEANTENAEKTLNAYEHALACGSGARSFLSFFFFAASFLFPSESFPLASFFFSFVVLRSCFRRANFFASSELGALVRLSRVFQGPPRGYFAHTRRRKGVVHVLSSLFFFRSLSFSLLFTGDGLSFALKNSSGEKSANFIP